MNCKHCGKPINLVPNAAERAAKDCTGKTADYYTKLFEYHTECTLKLRKDWRETKGYMQSQQSCCVCGSTHLIGIEPRFNYSVCEEHSKMSPVEVSYKKLSK